MGYFKITFPYLLFTAMIALVIWSNVRDRSPAPTDYAASIDIMASLEGNSLAPTGSADPSVCQHCGMGIFDNGTISDENGTGTLKFCCKGCKKAYLNDRLERLASKDSNRQVDPVCHMEINPTWGISHDYEGVRFFFCTEMCRNAFAADPLTFIAERCMVCKKPVIPAMSLPATYLGQTYHLCSDTHRQEFLNDPAKLFMHRMWGIPAWLYYISIGLVLILSFFMFEGFSFLKNRRGYKPYSSPSGNQPLARINLLQLSLVRRILLSRRCRFGAQLLTVAAFLLIIATGLFGNQNPALNVAPILTWTIWWCGLIVLIMGVITALIGYVLRFERSIIIALMLTVMFGNAGNFGLSLNLFAFGEEALVYASVYFVTSAILVYTVGIVLASWGKIQPESFNAGWSLKYL